MHLRILVVDDHEVVHQGIQMILRARQDWDICGQASNGAEAVELAKELKPDVIVMDITMPVMNGLEATRQITNRGLSSRIVVFTMHEAPGLAESVRSAGGNGLVLKSRAAIDLIEAIETVSGGGSYFKTDANQPSWPERKKSQSGSMMRRRVSLQPAT